MTDDEIRAAAQAAGFDSTYELWWERSIPKFRKLIEAELDGGSFTDTPPAPPPSKPRTAGAKAGRAKGK